MDVSSGADDVYQICGLPSIDRADNVEITAAICRSFNAYASSSTTQSPVMPRIDPVDRATKFSRFPL
jgi:hypothetical protein